MAKFKEVFRYFFLILISCIISSNGHLVGGWTKQPSIDLPDFDPAKDAYYAHLTNKTGLTFTDDENAKNEYDLTLVEVQTQVVNGFNYRFSFSHAGKPWCEATVYVPGVWMGEPPQISHDSCAAPIRRAQKEKRQKNDLMQAARRSKRSLALGGVSELGSGEFGEDIEQAADFATRRINMMTNSLYGYVRTSILSAKKQVVSGMQYSLSLELSESECRQMAATSHLPSCAVKQNPEVLRCKVSVWSRPWLEDAPYSMDELTSLPCARTPPKQTLLGGDGHDWGSYGAFEAFKTAHGRQYENSAEEKRRYAIFRRNMKTAWKLQETDKGDARYGATQFADLTQEEFKKYYTSGGASGSWDLSPRPQMKHARIPVGAAPQAWDWRNHSAVTEVKNQGRCGSCWAFSTTGNIEGVWAIKKGELKSLSEQELVDCDQLDDGCNGGLPSNAYEEIIRLGGLETEADYPYTHRDQACHFVASSAKIYINDSVNVTSNEDDMAAWLAQNGPISIGINAMAMQFYFGGISHPFSFLCPASVLDHGVLIVGYGVKHGEFRDTPYWIVKNSWGERWGEKGYYLVYRGAGVCGLNRMATSATIDP